MAPLTRRAVLAALGIGAGSALGLGYVLRGILESPTTGIHLTDADGCMGGVGMADMNLYMDMFMRHREISRTVEEIPGGIRTTTQSIHRTSPRNSIRMYRACTSISTRASRSTV